MAPGPHQGLARALPGPPTRHPTGPLGAGARDRRAPPSRRHMDHDRSEWTAPVPSGTSVVDARHPPPQPTIEPSCMALVRAKKSTYRLGATLAAAISYPITIRALVTWPMEFGDVGNLVWVSEGTRHESRSFDLRSVPRPNYKKA